MTNNPTAPGMEPVEVTQQDREAAALVFDARSRKAAHPASITMERHHAKVIRAGEGDDYDAVQAAAVARRRLTSPTPAEARPAPEAERVERLRAIILQMGRLLPGVILEDQVSDEFLTHLPDELAANLAAHPSESTDRARVREDAERWRAFVSSARFKMAGSANFDHSAYPAVSIRADKPADEWLHFGMEVWDKHPAGEDEQGTHGRNLLMAYVEHRRKELAALTPSPSEGRTNG